MHHFHHDRHLHVFGTYLMQGGLREVFELSKLEKGQSLSPLISLLSHRGDFIDLILLLINVISVLICIISMLIYVISVLINVISVLIYLISMLFVCRSSRDEDQDSRCRFQAESRRQGI